MPADHLSFELNKVRNFKATNEDSRLVEIELKSLIKKASLDFCHMWDSGGKRNPRDFVNSKEFNDFMELYKGFLEFPEILPDKVMDNIESLTNHMSVVKDKVNNFKFDDCSREGCDFINKTCLILESLN
ncbi:MAG: hypothetical protein QG646_1375 [Euryarchaeota archaeon]|nr:hypothetical protein [Euryarchaeota archaeon]